MDRYLGQRIRWTSCADLGQCATVLAPLGYTELDGPAVTLALRRLPASQTPRLGTLFLNPGGPGGSGVEFATQFDRTGLERFDVVGWDPRGVAASTPIVCDRDALTRYLDGDWSPDDATEQARLVESAHDFGRSCLAGSGPLLQHVSTAETVRDLDLLRSLVGDPTLTFYGQSYGTVIGSLYAAMFPDRVGRIVLDSALSLDQLDVFTTSYAMERELHAFADLCAEQGLCPWASDPEAVLRGIDELLRSLDQNPLAGGDRPLIQADGVRAVQGGLTGPQYTWSDLMSALSLAIEQSHGGALLQLADGSLGRDPDGHVSAGVGATYAIACLDYKDGGLGSQLQTAAKEAKQSPILGPHLGLDLTCPMWPVPAHDHRPVTGRAPLLMVGTTGDPRVPYEYTVQLAKKFGNSRLVTLEGHGHVAYPQSTCVAHHVVVYLTKGTMPAQRSRCNE